MNKNGLCFRLMALAFLSALMVTASAQQLKYTSIAQIGTSYKGSVQPLKPLVSQGGQCSAWSPAHWVISGVSPQGNALDLILPDKSMYAGYLSVGIPGSKAYKDTAFASPRAFLNTTISESGKYKVTWGKPLQDKLGMTILSFEIMDPNDSRQGKGVVIYQGAIDDHNSADADDIPKSKNYVAAALDQAMAGQPVTVASTHPYGCGVKYR